MLIDLRKIDETPLEFEIRIEPSEIDLSARFARLREPLEFVGKVRKEGWMTRVVGSAEALLERKCDRCLEKGEVDVAVSVNSAYVKYNALDEERETELEILGLEYSVIDRNQLDLKEVFAEHLLVAMPDRFVCSAECPGLCPECGANLRDAGCECNERTIDPRWAALSSIKEDLD